MLLLRPSPLVPLALAALALSGAALAQPEKAASGPIYTCIDDTGRRLTADRPIAACIGKEQRVLNRDGSLRSILPPTLTAEERAERETRERKAAEARAAQADAVRRDRNLMTRFPNEEAHRKARETALDPVRLAVRASEQRLKDLAAERKPLMDEAEFFSGRPMPAKLRAQIEANEVAVEAQKSLMTNQQAELVRINRLYDVELERLRRLWAGALPGSMGPLPLAQVRGNPPKAPSP